MMGPYAVDVAVINVTEQVRNEPSGAWRTLLAFGVTIRHLIGTLAGKDSPTINYPEQSRPYSERFRGTHVLTVRDDGSLKCVACYMCATVCPAECIYIEAGEHPNPEIEKFPIKFDIDMLRCIYCGFCIDACPEEAIVMSREHHQVAGDRNETIWGIEKLMERPGIDEKGLGYSPQTPLIKSKVYNRAEQKTCDLPSAAGNEHTSVLYESMIHRRS